MGNPAELALHDLYQERAAAKEDHAKVLRDFLLQVNARGEEEKLIDEEQGVHDPDLEESA